MLQQLKASSRSSKRSIRWWLQCLAAVHVLACGGGEGTSPAPTPKPMAADSVASSEIADGPLFLDATEASGLDFVHFNGMSGELYYVELMGGGAALFDMDQDGDLDLFLTQGRMIGNKPIEEATFPPRHPLPLVDRLYRNDLEVHDDGRREVRFTDITESSGIANTEYSMGVAVGDVDNDGWPDLFVTTWGGPNRLYRNLGGEGSEATFVDITEAAGVVDSRWAVAAAFFDADRDGRLDLYVGNYLDYDLSLHKECTNTIGLLDYCGLASYQPVRDVLYLNRGPARDSKVSFENVTAAAGVVESPAAGLGVVSGDFNGDGWPDLYVANDEFPNHLLMNLGDGRFRDEALLSGSAMNAEGKAEAGMGVDTADGDGDGDLDLFIAHLTDETNTLYVNEGGLFDDRTSQSELALPSFEFTGFGAVFLDYDNDGRVDIMVVNGAIKSDVEGLSRGEPYPLAQRNQLFRNLGGGRFGEVTDRAGDAFDPIEVSRGLAKGDLDNDGDVDVVVVNSAGPARVLLNQVGQESTWLGLRLLTAGELEALGAEVVIHAGESLSRHRYKTNGSYASAHDPRLIIGLGDHRGSVRAEVRWPDGHEETFEDLQPGSYLTLRQGQSSDPMGIP